MEKSIRRLIRPVRQLIKILRLAAYIPLAFLAKKIAYFAYRGLFHAEWDFNPPENFNHDIDVYYSWHRTYASHWLERGVFSSLALQKFKEPVAVELCCGEGFYDMYFYANSAKHIYACDIDRKAVSAAKRRNKRHNIVFAVSDIRKEIYPSNLYCTWGGVTNIIWDAAIAYFTDDEIDATLKNIHDCLKEKGGILSGMTCFSNTETSAFAQHKREFRKREDLEMFLARYFKNVAVIETDYSDRHNFYFYASDGDIPLAMSRG